MPQDKYIDIGLNIHIREWLGEGPPFMLVHGLASNCLTWEEMAEPLAAAGHHVITLDQRGHGLSDKPDDGYGLAEVTADLAKLIDALKLTQPIMVGQSWGGNVMLEFGARYPDLAQAFCWVDGGFTDLRNRPDGTWESIKRQLQPPDLRGMPRSQLKAYIEEAHPDWSARGVEGALANFETLPDGTIRPWLSQADHLAILRTMWEQTPADLYPHVTVPVLLCAADDQRDPQRRLVKRQQVDAAAAQLPNVTVRWFEKADHDIHVQKPIELAQLMREVLL